MSTSQKVGAGVVLLVVAIGLFVWWDEDEAACAVGSAGVVAIVSGITHGESAATIIASAAVPAACGIAVKKLTDEPDEAVTLEVQTPSGTTSSQIVTGNAILQTPTTPAADAASRVIQCFFSYQDSQVSYLLCKNGIIDPL